jgi:hypothetical protein
MSYKETWYAGKRKMKDIIKIEYMDTYRRCRTTGGRLLGKDQEKPQLYYAELKISRNMKQRSVQLMENEENRGA